MKRYLKVILSLMSFSFKRYLEHRWNTFGSIISSAISFALVLLFISILFSKTNAINGWSKEEIFFFAGVFQVFSSVFSFLFLRSINFLPNYIRRGDLDLILTKPVNAQILLSFRFTRSYEVINLLPGLIIIWYTSNLMGILASWNIVLLVLGMLAGLLILYGLYFSLAILTFWLIRFSSLTSIYSMISTPLAFPVDIFGKGAALFLTFIIPLGFMLTVPVGVFLGKSPLILLLLGGVVAIISVSFSIWFWNFALKHYTSASS